MPQSQGEDVRHRRFPSCGTHDNYIENLCFLICESKSHRNHPNCNARSYLITYHAQFEVPVRAPFASEPETSLPAQVKTLAAFLFR
jgi:hypothetical protein